MKKCKSGPDGEPSPARIQGIVSIHGMKVSEATSAALAAMYRQGYQDGLRDSFPPPEAQAQARCGTSTCVDCPDCTNCYMRHEVAPGMHQDVPHLKTQCMEQARLSPEWCR